MGKPGRPKAEQPRDMVVSVRLTLAEYRYLQALAMKQGESVGECMRALALIRMPKSGESK